MSSPYTPPVIAHYRHFTVPSEWVDDMKHIIGRKGVHFIRLTERHRCDYIWYNGEEKRVEIWGPYSRIMKCEAGIRKHAKHIRAKRAA